VLTASPLNITCAVVCAMLSFTFIETPLLRLRDRVRERTGPVQPVSVRVA
jgi:peptidoglycan/LPS O-acetylase OafA/YrhL